MLAARTRWPPPSLPPSLGRLVAGRGVMRGAVACLTIPSPSPSRAPRPSGLFLALCGPPRPWSRTTSPASRAMRNSASDPWTRRRPSCLSSPLPPPVEGLRAGQIGPGSIARLQRRPPSAVLPVDRRRAAIKTADGGGRGRYQIVSPSGLGRCIRRDGFAAVVSRAPLGPTRGPRHVLPRRGPRLLVGVARRAPVGRGRRVLVARVAASRASLEAW